MEFWYRIFYTLFLFNTRRIEARKVNAPAWWYALLQSSLSLLVLMLVGISAFAKYVIPLSESSVRFMVIPFTALVVAGNYLLLFKHYKVSKETGETPYSKYPASERNDRKYYFYFAFLFGLSILIMILFAEFLR